MSRGLAGLARSKHHPISVLAKLAMQKLGFGRSRPRRLVNDVLAAGTVALVGAAGFAVIAGEGPLVLYTVLGDAIPASLTGTDGDPVSGRAIVLERRRGACLL